MDKFKQYLRSDLKEGKISKGTYRMLKAVDESFDTDHDWLEEIFSYIKANESMTLGEMILDMYHTRIENE